MKKGTLLTSAAIGLVLTGVPGAAQTLSFKSSTFSSICQQHIGITFNLISKLATGDFNGDSKADLAYACADRIVVLLGKGDGAFQAPASTLIPSDFAKLYASYLLAAKLNRNSRATDLIYGADGSGFITFRSNSDGTFQVNPIPNFLTVLAVADFNGDKLSDVIV
jgi:hypothetical protein